MVGRLGKQKSAARLVRQLREALKIAELETLQEANQEKIESLVASGEIGERTNISKKLAAKHGIAVLAWDEDPEAFGLDKSLLESARGKMPKEEDLDGSDWPVLDIKEELDRAWEAAKETSKKVGEEA